LLSQGNPGWAYNTWFGGYTSDNGNTVYNNFYTMAVWMSSNTIEYDCTDPTGTCQFGWVSYTWAYPDPYQCTTIYTCSWFWGSLVSSPENQAEAVVHEASHAACKTEDSAQLETTCRFLAMTNPASAIDNASSYAYFALAVNADTSGTWGNGVWGDDTNFGDTTANRPSVAVSAEGTLIFAYQDLKTKNVHYRRCNLPNSWQNSSPIKIPGTNKYCLTSVGPAIACLGHAFYIVYVDGDSNSTTANDLVCVSTADCGATWFAPQVVVDSAATTLSPALTAFNGNLYCVYLDSLNFLQCVTGTITNGVLSWSSPQSVGSYQANNEPGLGVFDGCLVLIYTGFDNSLLFTTSSDGCTWSSPEQNLADNLSPAGPALVTWNLTPPVLMVLYRGLSDQNLRYTTYVGTWASGSWAALEFRESGNKSAGGPALAGYDTTLYAFYRAGQSPPPAPQGSEIFWSQAKCPQ
jgi:hypothetical protein